MKNVTPKNIEGWCPQGQQITNISSFLNLKKFLAICLLGTFVFFAGVIQPANAQCVSDADCDDGDICTVDECDDGECEHKPVKCNDENACTIDACDAASGDCIHTPIVCDDTDPCTKDRCTGDGCKFTPIKCNDDNGCTLDECDSGICVYTALKCDDGDLCTTDWCGGNECKHRPIKCKDDNPCTTDECVNGSCINTPIICDDNDPCTIDRCTGDGCKYKHVRGCFAQEPRYEDKEKPLQDPTDTINIECIFRTQTQGGWGSAPNGNNPGSYLHDNFNAAFASGVVVGCATGFTLTLTSAQAVTDYLPGGGSPSALTGSIADPTGYSNNLASQVVSLALSLGFDQYDANFGASASLLADAVIASGAFAGWSVQMVFDEANAILGGCPSPSSSNFSYSELNDILSAINQSFVDGNVHDADLFICPESNCPNLSFNIEGACLGEPTIITNLSTDINLNATYYLDLFNDGTIDLTASASDLPDDTSIIIPYADTFSYLVVVVNADGCADTLVDEFIVEECPIPCSAPPQLAFEFEDTLCAGLWTYISNQSQGVDINAIYYLEIYMDESLVGSSAIAASEMPDDTILYIPDILGEGMLDIIVVVVNSDGCSDTLEALINIFNIDSCQSKIEGFGKSGEEEENRATDDDLILRANPNPFNNDIAIELTLGKPTLIKAEVLTLDGKLIALLHDGNAAATTYSYTFDGSNLPGGIYICRVVTNTGLIHYSKLVLAK